MEKKFDVAKYIESVGGKLVSEVEDARELGADSNARGAGIESATRRQLKLLLPGFLDVGQGYIIDSYGNVSRQVDLVIFERSLCPVFCVNESPESTYYPCEGVLAAIEIKSRTSKKEFTDSCIKADSVRKLQRGYNVEDNGFAYNIRRYGEIGRLSPEKGDITSYGLPLDKLPFTDILTVLITGKTEATPNTVKAYFSKMQRSAPDVFLSLDGILAYFANEDGFITNARLASKCYVKEYGNPFSRFFRILYSWLDCGHTVAFESFGEYFNSDHL